jgi:hypothetical protein
MLGSGADDSVECREDYICEGVLVLCKSVLEAIIHLLPSGLETYVAERKRATRARQSHLTPLKAHWSNRDGIRIIRKNLAPHDTHRTE